MTRRTWVYLVPGASCCVWDVRRRGFRRDHTLSTFSAYEINCARKMTTSRTDVRMVERDRLVGCAVKDRALSGELVYAFHCKATDLVKIGRTTDLAKRWSKFETGGGTPVQLLAVWRVGAESREYERSLFDRFAAFRTLGEWFRANEVIAGLTDDCGAATRSPINRWWLT